jgi:hypothetical protein
LERLPTFQKRFEQKPGTGTAGHTMSLERTNARIEEKEEAKSYRL